MNLIALALTSLLLLFHPTHAYTQRKQDALTQAKLELNASLQCVVWKQWGSIDQPTEGHVSVRLDQHHAALYGGCGHSSTLEHCGTTLHVVNINTKHWEEVPVENGFVVNGGAGVADDENDDYIMYLFGGVRTQPGAEAHVASYFSNELNVLIKEGNVYRWKTLQVAGEAPPPAQDATLVLDEGRLFLFGGFSDLGFFNDVYSVELTDLNNLAWKKLDVQGDTPSARRGQSASILGHLLFVFGGSDGMNTFNDMWSIDLLSSQPRWFKVSQKGTNPAPRALHTAFFVESKLVVFGGCDFSHSEKCYSDFFVYDTDSSQWVYMNIPPDLRNYHPSSRMGHSAVYFENLGILIFGGCSLAHECPDDIVRIDIDGVCDFSCINGDYHDHHCVCNRGYSGKFCDEVVTGCPNECSSHGTCEDICKCDDGWTGNDCSIKACPNDCSDNGLCSDGVCDCYDGFSGEDCSEECNNHGSWIITDSGQRKCDCDASYAGDFCEEAICPNDCSGQDHGRCVDGSCFCLPKYSGDDCSIDIDCSGHGKFFNDRCNCDDGWGLKDCSKACLNDCSGQGKCIGSEFGIGICHCDEGYMGKDCSTKRCKNDCSFQGICNTGECECYNGYFEEDCSLKVDCPKNCSSHGVCNRDGSCECSQGWKGEDCNTPKCPMGCSERGDCRNGVCHCEEGFSGVGCELRCPGGCSGKGVCFDGRCQCNPNYEGSDCGSKKKCPNDCSGNGICDYAHRKCTCKPGFSGPDCSEYDECQDSCSGNGECYLGTCLCEPGNGGPKCDQEERCTPECKPNQGKCFAGKCHCYPGFVGKTCSKHQTCPEDCNRRGICLKGKCVCEPGYGGDSCDTITSPSDICPQNCTDHGVCHLGRCFCVDGYDGRDCSIRLDGLCENECSGQDHGICMYGKCYCYPGFYGDKCQFKNHCSEKCTENGICYYGKCFCVPGYTGESCDERLTEDETVRVLENDIVKYASKDSECDDDCWGHGFCVNGECRCLSGYGGSSCKDSIGGILSTRCPNDCNNNGQCLMGRCYCSPTFYGSNCEHEQVMKCPDHCNNRGICSYGKCFCYADFSGESCEIDESMRDSSLLEADGGICYEEDGVGTSHMLLGGLGFCCGVLVMWASGRRKSVVELSTV